MIEFHVYPGGKKRIVTFSYDDGADGDARLIDLMNRYGVKGTFHLNGISKYANCTEEQAAALRELYAGHEVSCHTLRHGWLSSMPRQSAVLEIMENRRLLEPIFGVPVVGLSYPCSGAAYNEDVMTTARACGIVYSRTTKNTHTFSLPENFLEWHPTCHHNPTLHDVTMSLCDHFLEQLDSEWCTPLFYIWGHSHEYHTEEDWQKLEQLIARLAGNEKIWYATNLEIYHYIMAQKRLQISADETVFYNPSDIPVWVERNNAKLIEIPAGARITVK